MDSNVNKSKKPPENAAAGNFEAKEAHNNAPSAENAPARVKIPLCHRTWAKAAAFIIIILMVAVTAAGIVGVAVMFESEVYTKTERDYKYEHLSEVVEGYADVLCSYIDPEGGVDKQEAQRYLSKINVARAELKSPSSSKPGRELIYDSGLKAGEYAFYYEIYHLKDESGDEWYTPYPYVYGSSDITLLGAGELQIVLTESLTKPDTVYLSKLLFDILYALRYWIYAIIAAALIIAAACYVFLLCGSGRHKGEKEPRPGWGTKLPFDLLCAAVGFGLVSYCVIAFDYPRGFVLDTLFAIIGIVAAASAFLGLSMSFALRVKLGGWWKNTVIWRVLRIALRALRWLWRFAGKMVRGLGALLRGLWRFAGKMVRGLGALLRGLPLIWKTVLLLGALCVYNIIALAGGAFWMFFVEVLVIIPAVLYAALMLRRLYQSSEALAAGNLGYQIDTKRLVWDFKRAAQNLNSIGRGMTLAVEERTRSERMKTELITNVSHDIKTPLTSIINYSDLIEKEPCENEKITEYAGVLHRQSERLKRLIDDLVEASKASTGNLEVILAPCELNVLLTQTAGEYMQRMEDAGLELVTQMPGEELCVMADGRRMWRVFDNLASNACKYAMPGTRVYITLQRRGESAVVAFKNTSRLPLNISAEELMERFVRGDASRSTEGSGLGLAIAKNLMELQNGTLELSIDGDFFKAEVALPIVE